MIASSSEIEGLNGLRKLLEFTDFWSSLADIFGGISEHVGRFFDSEQLMSTPFIDIFCSLAASISRHYPGRKPKNSDLYDIAIIASVLPYCDVLTADSFMQPLVVKTLHFDEKYNAQVFGSSRPQEELLLQWIKDLDK